MMQFTGFSADIQIALRREQQRLEIAEKWARINRSEPAKQFDKGRHDRLSGLPCSSTNGSYLEGWYSAN